MNPSDFLALREQAISLFNAQPKKKGEPLVSLDAIFAALNTGGDPGETTSAKQTRRLRDDEPAEWFHKTLAKVKGTGEAMTVSKFLMVAERWPATRTDQLAAGRWLREAGYQPRKSGGQFLYDL